MELLEKKITDQSLCQTSEGASWRISERIPLGNRRSTFRNIPEEISRKSLWESPEIITKGLSREIFEVTPWDVPLGTPSRIRDVTSRGIYPILFQFLTHFNKYLHTGKHD